MKNKKRKLWLKVVAITLGALAVITTANLIFLKITSNANYKHNLSVQQSYLNSMTGNFINSQSSTKLFKVGVKDSKFNGCGWISIYNANQILSIDVPIADIINEIDFTGLLANGLLGTNPLAITSFYQKRGVDTNVYFNRDVFSDKASQSTAFIIGRVTYNTGHYNAGQLQEGDKFVFYNNYAVRTMQSYFDTFDNHLMFLITLNQQQS